MARAVHWAPSMKPSDSTTSEQDAEQPMQSALKPLMILLVPFVLLLVYGLFSA